MTYVTSVYVEDYSCEGLQDSRTPPLGQLAHSQQNTAAKQDNSQRLSLKKRTGSMAWRGKHLHKQIFS